MKTFLIILLLALIASFCGFHRYVWFISLGYGAAIVLIGAGLFFLFPHALTIGTILQCVLFIVYGCRLSGYLIYRDRKTAYKRRMKGEVKADDGIPFGAKIGIWISASLLYVLQTSPVVFRLMSAKGTDAFCIAGILISTCGLILETAADIQKNNAKKKKPGRFVDTGLYRVVRCPNYLGEMIFWTASITLLPTGSVPLLALPASFTSCSAVPAGLKSVRIKTMETILPISTIKPQLRS